MTKHGKKLTVLKLILIIFFFVSVVFPLIKMLTNINNIDILELIASDQFKVSLKNSIYVSLVASIISILLSSSLALCILRTNIKYKSIFSIFLTLPMLVPSMAHGIGLIILLGTNGIFTRLLGIRWNIYGFWGIVIGTVMYSFPVSFLMIGDIFKYEDSTPYEAADVLGFSRWDKFKAITFPYIKKPMISIFFAIFTLIVTDYGVPLMIGGKFTTLPVLMYQEVVGRLDFDKGGVMGLILLTPAIIAFILDILRSDKGNMNYTIKEFKIKKDRIRDNIAYLFISIIILTISLPIIMFVVLTFMKKYPVDLTFTLNNILNTFKMNGGKYLFNSITISFMVAIIGTIIAYIIGYLTSRTPSKLTKTLHLISISSLAVPGIVLGLAYVITFNKSMIYGSYVILILVNLVHFFATPYLMVYNTLNKLNENLESVGMTLGISRIKMIRNIFIPQTIDTIFEMTSYFFVNSMITISAVSFLANTKNKPISLLINQFEGNMMIEASAFVSLIILLINILVKGLVYIVKKRNIKKGLI